MCIAKESVQTMQIFARCAFPSAPAKYHVINVFIIDMKTKASNPIVRVAMHLYACRFLTPPLFAQVFCRQQLSHYSIMIQVKQSATQHHITQLEKLEKLIQSMNMHIAIATNPELISRRITCSERTSL